MSQSPAPGEAAAAGSRPSLDKRSKLVVARPRRSDGLTPVRWPEVKAGWKVTAFPGAGEAVVSFSPVGRRPTRQEGLGGGATENALRSQRRARVMVRRYCVANGIDRLVTLTFAPPFCTDAKEFRGHVSRFIRRMRCYKGKSFPYVWVPELHGDGVRLHVHLVIGFYVPQKVLVGLWGHGIVDVRLFRARGPEGPRSKARRVAHYVSKYVGKAFEDESKLIGAIGTRLARDSSRNGTRSRLRL